MIEIMTFVAFIAGLLIGLVAMYKNGIDHLLTVVYNSMFSTKQGFMTMYESADDEVTYSFFIDPTDSINNYADYLRLHAAAKKTAYKRFRYYYDNVTKTLVFNNLPIMLLPAIIFWSNWYCYIIGSIIAILVLAFYKTFVKGYKVGFYQRFMVTAVLTNYINDSQADQIK